MNVDRWQEVQRVFHAALDRPDDERTAFIQNACANDPELHAEVESMLAAEQGGSDFCGSGQDALGALAADVMDAPTPSAPLTGRRVGPYTIVRQIGRGGMGTVYLAEREDVGLTAALKVVAGGLAAPERVERFLIERR